MQYRILDRQKLTYKDGGFVRDWYIDNDYINNNNSTIDIVSATEYARVGDLVFLIDTSGAYDKGFITGIDNEALQISYKSDKELFNDNILNPLAQEFTDDTEISMVGPIGLESVKNIITCYWANSVDPCRRLPMVINLIGEAEIYWTWQETQINFVDWLVSLFKDYSIIIDFDIDFDIIEGSLDNRNAVYIITISVVNNDNDIIKDNVSTQTIKYTKETLPEKTCCYVIDKESKEILTTGSGKNLFNTAFGKANAFLNNSGAVYDLEYAEVQQSSNVSAYIEINGSSNYILSWSNGDGVGRNIAFYDRDGKVISFINNNDEVTKVLTYKGSSGSFEITTPSSAKKMRICYAKYATNIQLERGSSVTTYEAPIHNAIFYLCVNSAGVYYITDNKDSLDRILPVRTVFVEYDSNSGDADKIENIAANELKLSSLNHAIEIEIPRDTKMFDFEYAKFGDRYKIITKNGTITSIYSGRKESSSSSMVTLLFGIGRLNFTDLLKDTLRDRKYTKIYENRR